MKKAGLLNRIFYEARKMDWKVNSQAIGTGFESVKYLAPYVFKVAISNARIVKVENRTVSFKYKKVKSNRWRTCRLDAMEFIRRFLQHVLPTGFMKVRYYGFLHPCSSVSLETIIISIEAANGAKIVAVQITIKKYVPSCPALYDSAKGTGIVNGVIKAFFNRFFFEIGPMFCAPALKTAKNSG